MTLGVRPGMSACAFITDGLYRYLKEHRGEEPVELVLHPGHKRMLRKELGIRRSGVTYDGCWFNNIPVLEDPCCRTPGWSRKTGSAGSCSPIIARRGERS
jgi:hypothetical protein